MKVNELEELLDITCSKQQELLTRGLWDSEEYKMLERIKAKLRKKIKKIKKMKKRR